MSPFFTLSFLTTIWNPSTIVFPKKSDPSTGITSPILTMEQQYSLDIDLDLVKISFISLPSLESSYEEHRVVEVLAICVPVLAVATPVPRFPNRVLT